MGLEPIRAVARYPLKIVRLPFRHICLFFITCIILSSSPVIVKGNIHVNEKISEAFRPSPRLTGPDAER